MKKIRWFQNNWKWLLPLTIISAFFPITICILTTVLLVSFIVIKSSWIYKKTITLAQENDKVIAQIGSPIKSGLFVMGNISRRKADLMITLSIPVSGPQGDATTFAVARKKKNKWIFSTLQVQLREHRTYIDLLQHL